MARRFSYADPLLDSREYRIGRRGSKEQEPVRRSSSKVNVIALSHGSRATTTNFSSNGLDEKAQDDIILTYEESLGLEYHHKQHKRKHSAGCPPIVRVSK